MSSGSWLWLDRCWLNEDSILVWMVVYFYVLAMPFAAGELVYLVHPVYSQIYPEGSSEGLPSPPAARLWTIEIGKGWFDPQWKERKCLNVWRMIVIFIKLALQSETQSSTPILALTVIQHSKIILSRPESCSCLPSPHLPPPPPPPLTKVLLILLSLSPH